MRTFFTIEAKKLIFHIICNIFATLTSPDGGIGRRAGLKHQWSNPCRFDPGSGYQTKCKCLTFKHLHFSFCFLHHACTTEWAVLWQKLCFSKNFSVGPSTSAFLEAKLVKVGVKGKLSNLQETQYLNIPHSTLSILIKTKSCSQF